MYILARYFCRSPANFFGRSDATFYIFGRVVALIALPLAGPLLFGDARARGGGIGQPLTAFYVNRELVGLRRVVKSRIQLWGTVTHLVEVH